MAEKILVTGGSGFIGTHLIRALIKHGHEIKSIDIKQSMDQRHEKIWIDCDIKDYDRLKRVFDEFRPTRVIHLAARASLTGKTVEDFPDNTIGTKNIVESINRSESVALFLNTSTQYVVRPGQFPKDSEYLSPYTAYGESKAEAERIVRVSCKRPWVIVRPTNIWGPEHPYFPFELWRYLERRYYVHPGYSPIRKHYGYIDNAVAQIIQIALSDPPTRVAGKVYYISDPPIDSYEWMNGFSLNLSGKKARRVPIAIWKLMALLGSILNLVKIKFPVNLERLFRLTVNETLPNSMIVTIENDKIVSLSDGIARCAAWYRHMRASNSGAQVRQ